MLLHALTQLLLSLVGLSLAIPQGSFVKRSLVERATDECPAEFIITNKETRLPNTGLDRLSHKDLPTGSQINEYVFHPSAGQGTCAYTIDTGVRPDHDEFKDEEGNSRILKLWNCTATLAAERDDPAKNFGCREVSTSVTGFDDNGHGTHTAATVLGRKYGVAPKAKLIAFKVLSAAGSGSSDDINSAIKLAAYDATKRRDNGECKLGTACNLSLGTNLVGTLATILLGLPNTSKTISQATKDGLFCSIAAGNADQPAWTAQPANAIDACTVGALDEKNGKACFSNFGPYIPLFEWLYPGFPPDVWAPGQRILSAWPNSTDGSATYSGTSMAAPKVAGLKLYLDSLCIGERGKLPKDPVAACKYIKDTGISFQYFGGTTLGLSGGLPVPVDVPLPTCDLQNQAKIQTGKRAWNGGDCGCRTW